MLNPTEYECIEINLKQTVCNLHVCLLLLKLLLSYVLKFIEMEFIEQQNAEQNAINFVRCNRVMNRNCKSDIKFVAHCIC